MPRVVINPPALYSSTKFGFSHATRSEGRVWLHLAGQVAWDAEYNLIGPRDIRLQMQQALANLRVVLAEAGATPADVVRMHTYLVDHTADDLKYLASCLKVFYGDAPPAANTVIGVAQLAMPEFLCEIEVTAVLD
ncbi:MAG: RidA family protein [Gammaproteobacteria bacterium]|nr:RidA family protein [Gammaproteobacteria bacterium]